VSARDITTESLRVSFATSGRSMSEAEFVTEGEVEGGVPDVTSLRFIA
jgi:hypothetical protein